MNNPRCSTPDCQDRPVRQHQRRNNAIPPAYAFVVSSEPSLPNRICLKNSSASPTTTRSSSITVQYRTPDGSLTTNARTRIPRSRDRHHQLLPVTSTTHMEMRSETSYVSALSNMAQHRKNPKRRTMNVIELLELAQGVEQVGLVPAQGR